MWRRSRRSSGGPSWATTRALRTGAPRRVHRRDRRARSRRGRRSTPSTRAWRRSARPACPAAPSSTRPRSCPIGTSSTGFITDRASAPGRLPMPGNPVRMSDSPTDGARAAAGRAQRGGLRQAARRSGRRRSRRSAGTASSSVVAGGGGSSAATSTGGRVVRAARSRHRGARSPRIGDGPGHLRRADEADVGAAGVGGRPAWPARRCCERRAPAVAGRGSRCVARRRPCCGSGRAPGTARAAAGKRFRRRARLGRLGDAEPGRADLEHRHVRLDDVAPRRPSAPACRECDCTSRLRGQRRSRRCTRARGGARRWDARPRVATCRCRSASGVRCWMKKIGSGFLAPSDAARHRSSWPPGVRRPPSVGVAHVDAARAHAGHVGGEIVALHGDVAQAAARRQELAEPGAGLACDRPSRTPSSSR